ncbi:hypothetical protein CP10139811_1607 [Chlamydia ibidis]|uniref:Uncharacterized protein n=1 Tax=Chlamydia ibidis TaxID=1405396 RepID=S7J5J7_9CHLA|nr:hypothetical protein CP10139811_1607 [Chlamydia ibidis]
MNFFLGNPPFKRKSRVFSSEISLFIIKSRIFFSQIPHLSEYHAFSLRKSPI